MSLLEMTDKVAKVADKTLGDTTPMLSLIDSSSNRLIDSMKSLPGSRDLQALGFPMVDDFFQTDSQSPVVRDHRQDRNGYQGGHDRGQVRDHRGEHRDGRPVVRDHRQESQGYNSDHSHRDEWNDYDRHDRPVVRDHRQGHDSDYDHRHERDYRDDNCCCDNYRRWNFNDCMNDLFGPDRNPYDDMLGGRNAFDHGMQLLSSLLGRNPEDLLNELFGRRREEKGGGGFFGKLFSGVSGLLGGGGGGGLGGILGGILGGGSEGGGLGGILGGILGGGSEGGGGGLLGTLLPVALKVAPLLL